MDKDDHNFFSYYTHFTIIFSTTKFATSQFPLILTVWFGVKPSCHDPSGGCLSVLSTNSSKVSLLQVPRLIAQITPALRYCSTPLHHPPAHPFPFTVHNTVPIAVQKKREQIRQICQHCTISSLLFPLKEVEVGKMVSFNIFTLFETWKTQ